MSDLLSADAEIVLQSILNGESAQSLAIFWITEIEWLPGIQRGCGRCYPAKQERPGLSR